MSYEPARKILEGWIGYGYFFCNSYVSVVPINTNHSGKKMVFKNHDQWTENDLRIIPRKFVAVMRANNK